MSATIDSGTTIVGFQVPTMQGLVDAGVTSRPGRRSCPARRHAQSSAVRTAASVTGRQIARLSTQDQQRPPAAVPRRAGSPQGTPPRGSARTQELAAGFPRRGWIPTGDRRGQSAGSRRPRASAWGTPPNAPHPASSRSRFAIDPRPAARPGCPILHRVSPSDRPGAGRFASRSTAGPSGRD